MDSWRRSSAATECREIAVECLRSGQVCGRVIAGCSCVFVPVCAFVYTCVCILLGRYMSLRASHCINNVL